MLRIAELLEPLKSGGSLPWLSVGDDGRRYVVKFAGAGHGGSALVAELVVSRLARRWGLRVPAVSPIWLDDGFGKVGTDEFWDVLDRSAGWNLAVDYLVGSSEISARAAVRLPHDEVRAVVWVDALFANYDRTAGSVNLLRDESGDTWMIDHGACRFLQRTGSHLDVFELAPGHLFGSRHPKHHLVGLAPSGASYEEIESDLADLPPEWLDEAGLAIGTLLSATHARVRSFRLWAG